MNFRILIFLSLGLTLVTSSVFGAVSAPVSLFSIPQKRAAIDAAVGQLEAELAELPRLQKPFQFDAFGYHSGYLPVLEELPEEPRWTVEIDFGRMGPRQIILVPAIDRRFDEVNSYGFPTRFRIIGTNSEGNEVLIADWMDHDCPVPGRMPIIFKVEKEEDKSTHIRIEVFRGATEEGREFFALDEVLGATQNDAFFARKVSASSEYLARPYWDVQYLVDNKTSLGLPLAGTQVRAGESIHDFSVEFQKATIAPCVVELDFGRNIRHGWLHFFPARPSGGVIIPGYGFPGKIDIEVIREQADGARAKANRISGEWNAGSPGNNMVQLPCYAKTGRWIRLICDDLPEYDGTTVFALGELYSSRNLRRHAVRHVSFEGFPAAAKERAALLTNGTVAGRPVMFLMEWLRQIERRFLVTEELARLRQGEERLRRQWHDFWLRAGEFAVALAVLVALMVILYSVVQRRKSLQEIQQEQQATELEQMKIRFFTHISHELRTPLTMMLGPLEKLLRIQQAPEGLEYVSLAHRNARRLKTLVDQLLDFRKLQDGREAMEWAVVDLAEHVRNSFDVYRSMATDKQMDYQLELVPGLGRATVDSGKLQKIFDNLISNALKYTPEQGRVFVRFERMHDEPSDLGMLVLTVEDSGSGIAPDDLPHVFEQYYRAGGLQSIQAGGSGIGLALVKELVDLWGGEVSVESPVVNGFGTRFVVHLPVVQPSSGLLEEARETSELQGTGVRGGQSDPVQTPVLVPESAQTLLLVDDNEDVRSFLRLELNKTYRILEAENGQAGLDLALKAMPDLIVTDVMMPVMDGVEFCRQIKTDEKISHIPVIMLTARGSLEHQLDGLETGADDYVTKPFSAPLLTARIHNLLESRQRLRERFGREISIEPSAITVTSADDLFLQRAIGLVEDSMGDVDFCVKEFAKKMGMDRNTLRLKLKALVDQSPQAFIRILRLKRAKQLLEQGSDPVAEVAFQVGFMEPTNFSRSFKTQFGISPSTCRKTS